MNIGIVTLGTRGDVAPLVAAGLGLKAAGHTVRIAAPHEYADLAISLGLDFYPLQTSFRSLFATKEGSPLLAEKLSPVSLLYKSKTRSEPLLDMMFGELWESCRGMDALLYTVLTLPVRRFANDLGIQAFPVCLQPLGKTSAHPNLLFTRFVPPSRLLNMASHLMAEQALSSFFRSHLSRWRMRSGTPVGSLKNGALRHDLGRVPVFNGYSATVAPKPDDWGANMHVTGYWFLNGSDDRYHPPAELESFLTAGPPPILIGFGSMNDSRVVETITCAVAGLRERGKRVVLLRGGSCFGGEEYEMDDDIYVTDEIPHEWILPRVAAMIHHGGAGTTAASVKAGIPSIVIPFFFDQLFWGRRLHALGVAPAPIAPERVTVESIGAAIKLIDRDDRYAERVAVLSRQLATEDGVGNFVAAFHDELLRCATTERRR